ncbi:Erythromycin esterase homolog [Halopseudomonas xinjiangensis]|uniref:Erythromycin esterase homolog n=1 Tax=Halopseudomonas xinjiangensis TaxID=487184 RepID=A0A1H1VUT8_9GAMM|nr:erythromycin esterase family protein [Halopseudomonas xinjiangensis]SDS88445.1 Erythromycin esterase homolog [Halopseudomonas xinjiangensis]
MSAQNTDARLIAAIDKQATTLRDEPSDFDAIIEAARGKQVVLIGEASHGTQDFYRHRAQITRRLIEELGFAGVAVEADWPEAYALNRYVWGREEGRGASQVLDVFKRFPRWMWANTEVRDFLEWLGEYNASQTRQQKEERPVGFYGLDLYSMGSSANAVIKYLDKADPAAAKRARERYACLHEFFGEPHFYGQSVAFGLSESCEKDITEQVMELQNQSQRRLLRLGMVAGEEQFAAEQNARLVRNAEEYYRAAFSGGQNTWNLRDGHMFETLQALRSHLSHQLGRDAPVVVWAHNSHIGDASATDMGRRGELNIGQLAREHYGDKALLVGFSTAEGEVTAASDWDSPAELKRVRTPLADSYERIFQQVDADSFLLDLRQQNEMTELLAEPRLQRAIGVIYRPETERQSHYFRSSLPRQYDFMVHFDWTVALQSLTDPSGELDQEPAETYPSGL